jgi:hypothetical protein
MLAIASFFSAALTAPATLVYASTAIDSTTTTFPNDDACLLDATVPTVIFTA